MSEDTIEMRVAEPPRPHRFTFMGEDDEAIGTLDWSDGTLKFEGDADESAQVFFNIVVKLYAGDLPLVDCPECGVNDD